MVDHLLEWLIDSRNRGDYSKCKKFFRAECFSRLTEYLIAERFYTQSPTMKARRLCRERRHWRSIFACRQRT
ncbi:hypothetical protein LWI28_024314 [Acer negundo]|uniref:Uncharacterized protein n=1 Tax=Acer negundo TaxID=4023 RepID=A0AAD5IG83_ACENE|nr:hypothetical protein LWI28_024314 [Acer negundo]KAK4837971.1 hypothetical protein QYF36_009982 [Acer negundo]